MISKARCEFLLGKKWYPFLIKKDDRPSHICLLSDVGYIHRKLYVRITVSGGRYMFSCFSNPVELKNYIDKFHPSLRCFDEIVVDGQQKPRFDIDIERVQETDLELDIKCQDLINQVISAVLNYIPSITPEHNIRLFTSHGKDKRSAHIVIDKIYHENCREAVGFFDKIVTQVSEEYRRYLDRGIYGKLKQLRIMGCCKWENDRVKILRKEYMYKSKKITSIWPDLDNDIIRFMSSLLTVTSGGAMISGYAKPNKRYTECEVNNEQVRNIMTLARQSLGDNFKYSLDTVKGSKLVLVRLAPSLCVMCNRIHHKQHPYMFAISSGDIFFNCGRNAKSYRLGNIGDIKIIDKTLNKESEVKASVVEGNKIITKNAAVFNFGTTKACFPEATISVVVDVEEKKSETTKTEIYSSSDVISQKLSSIGNKTNPRRRTRIKEDVTLSSLVNFNNIPW